ncbi:MAG: antibiotic biosynthesis monooxygenase [Pseudomonadota bacterium]
MPATLINVFIVPADKEEEFLSNWKKTANFFQSTPNTGFIETHLHRNTGAGNGTFTFINIASWDSAEHWKNSHDAYSPTEYLIPGVKGHPSIYECIVDLVGVGRTGSGGAFLSMQAHKS